MSSFLYFILFFFSIITAKEVENDLTFCLQHTGFSEVHYHLLKKSIEAIREIYPFNKIMIIKTHTNISPYNNIKNITSNIEVYDPIVPNNAHAIGAMKLIIEKCKTENFLLLHDTMFLLRRLPQDIMGKSLYSVYHFSVHKEINDNEFNCRNLLKVANLTDIEKKLILDFYDKEWGRKWHGVFGVSFGGKVDYIKKLDNIINFDNNQNNSVYYGKRSLQAFERYVGLLSYYYNWIDLSFNNSINNNNISLDGDYGSVNGINVATPLEEIRKRTNVYIFKYFASRNDRKL